MNQIESIDSIKAKTVFKINRIKIIPHKHNHIESIELKFVMRINVNVWIEVEPNLTSESD